MSQVHTSHAGAVASGTNRLSLVALALGVLGVAGSILSWDVLPGGGFVWGAPLDVAAVAVGLTAVRHGAPSRWAAVTGIVLGAAMLLMMIVWTLAALG